MTTCSFPFDELFVDQDDQVFLMRFGKDDKTNEQFMSMTVERLKRLSVLLPALPYLLFGHPSGLMRQKSLARHEESGMLLVEFPSYMKEDVSRDDFVNLVNVALGIRSFEINNNNNNNSSKRLSEVISFLGGCELVERMLSGETDVPTSPTYDKSGRFQWLVQVIRDGTQGDYNSHFRELVADGWQFAGENGKGAYLLRKPKSIRFKNASQNNNEELPDS